MLDSTHLLTSRSGGLVAGALLVVALVTSGTLANRAIAPMPDGHHVEAEALAGYVRPTGIAIVNVVTAMTVTDVLVTVGDELKAGQPIAARDAVEAGRATAQLAIEFERATRDVSHRERVVADLEQSFARVAARAADAPGDLALAERDAQLVPVRQAKDSPERAQAAYDQAVLKLRRAEKLAAAGLVAQQDVEEARYALRVAADDVEVAKEAAATAQRVRAAEQAQARARRDLARAEQLRQLDDQRAALEQARLQLKSVQVQYETARTGADDPYVRAPRDGAIVELLVAPGDRMAPGATVARMARLDPMTVDVDVPAALVNRLRAGGAALVDVPAANVAAAAGTVRVIAPLPNDAGRYTVQVTFANPAHARVAGQTAAVRFVGTAAPEPR